jgi:hypothetical protein
MKMTDAVMCVCGNFRFNNAGVAGEGSREGYEDVDSSDPEAMSKKMLESSFEESVYS